MNCKNNIFILRNIHKSNDEELVNYTFKKILPKIYNYYKEHRNTNEIIYNIDNCYKKYFPNLYLELLGVYNLSDLTKMIYRKNNYNKIDYIIKFLKEEKVKLENYREEAKNILSIENIKNYSLYIDGKYLNKERIKKCVLIVTNITMDVKPIVTIFQKIYIMKNLKKNHSNNFSKSLWYEKFEKTIVTIFQKNLLYEKFEKTIIRIFQKLY